MRLVHKDFEFRFEFKENKQGLLIVENPCLLREFIQNFRLGDEGRFVLSDNNELLQIDKNLAYIIDFFNINLNERKILTKLNEIIKNEILNSELFLECNELCCKLETLSEQICLNIDYTINYTNDINTGTLIKFLNFKFKDDEVNILERLIDYLKINAELLKIKLFVFVNAMSYFNEYEIDKILEFVNYQKMNILFIENKLPEKIDGFGQIYIIDKDYCQICLKDV